MMKLTGGQAVVESLRVENTSHLFGLIGSATMEIFDALYDADDIRFIGVHDERTGAHMADGYARASGKPGVVLAGQNGPGATNLVTGLAQANAAFFSSGLNCRGAVWRTCLSGRISGSRSAGALHTRDQAHLDGNPNLSNT